MKKRILLVIAVLGIVYVVFSSHSTGPAKSGYDCTGAETAVVALANPTGCSETGGGCHSSAATTSIGVAITLDSTGGVPTTHYVGGQTYTVTITGTPTGTSNTWYGFQLAALKDTVSSPVSNSNAGYWDSVAADLPASTQYTPAFYTKWTQLSVMEHSTPMSLSGSSFTKSFKWTAPVAGTGPISFWGAVNFVNHNAIADNGDVWNTNHVIIRELVHTASVASVTNELIISAYPNPVNNTLNIRFGNMQTSTCLVQVFDIMGRSVYCQPAVPDNKGIVSIDASGWVKGVYHVMVEQGGVQESAAVIK